MLRDIGRPADSRSSLRRIAASSSKRVR